MAAGLDSQRLGLVFSSRPDILEGIQKAADTPARVQLFNDIASFVHERVGDAPVSEPAHKRRRVDIQPSQNGAPNSTTNGAGAISPDQVAQENTLLEVKEISVSVPQRKKFELCFTAQHIYARAPNTTAPVPGVIFAWKDIEYAFYLPVPEKQQVQHNYVLFPRDSYLPSKDATSSPEPFVFTIPAGAPKPGVIGGPNASAAAAVSDSYSTLFHWAINKCLKAAANNVQITAADPAKFRSAAKQAFRPKDPAVHVKAFRGSKDGYLFFLENGILWGFKKPLLFIPLSRIAALSYTNVLQRTFNIVVELFTGVKGDDGEEETDEIEFGMLDQEDYNGISDKYVNRHGLQDRSLADQRKAKLELAENAKGKKGADGADVKGEDGADGGLSELQKAQEQLEDEEDEDEEDYDPGSEGESEGSGTSDDDDDDDDDDDGDEVDGEEEEGVEGGADDE